VLTSETFNAIGRANVDDEQLKATYGPEAGALLWDQKTCEDNFEATNTMDGSKMEHYESEVFSEEHRPVAFENQMRIEHNVPRLVRIFRRDDMRARLLKEFKDIKAETYPFIDTFKMMKDLWVEKLCTSLEEYNRN